MAFALFALFVITVLVPVLFGIKIAQTFAELAQATPEQKAAMFDIKQARLHQKGLHVEAGQATPTPEATYTVIAIVLVVLCASVGMTFSSIFFLACYACCLSDMLEDIIAINVVQHLQEQPNIEPVAA